MNLDSAESGSESSFPLGNPLSKRRMNDRLGSVIEVKKVNKKIEKLLNNNIIEFASHYINNFVKTTHKDWKITKNFVTSMVEINYNKLMQMESKLSMKAAEFKNAIKIRFI